ncbi:MAG: sel1 repeat family protein [Selenomonadaceae bacterium]|nr:sel1 repeat family protein [Selenomonadaceae bacterium]
MTGEDYFQIGLRLLEYPDEAKKYFKTGAELNNPECMLKLADDFGEGEAIRWVIKKLIAEKNYEAALTKLDDYAVDSEDELRYETTFKMLDDKWTAGTISTDEMLTLADLYERGKGTEKNPQKAKELRDHVKFINTSFAAAAGDAGSMFQLGKMYLHGDGAEKDIAEAKAWFGKATQAGNVAAKTELDKITTFERLFLKPESELDVEELRHLASFYRKGSYCPKDNTKAEKLENLANFKETKAEADNGKPEAVYEIANRYLMGHGVEKNLYEAAKYVEKYSKLKPENYSKLHELYRGLSQGFKEMAYRAKPPVEPSKPIRFDKWGIQI